MDPGSGGDISLLRMNHPFLPNPQPNYGKAGDFSAAECRNLRAHYCAEAELVDRWVGRVLRKIDDLNLWQNSIVIFTSDHGISIGEHNRTGKLNINDKDNRYWPIYQEVARVPFLIVAPGLPAGHSVTQLMQSADILPTLLDMLGGKIEPPEPFHGRSFLMNLKAQTDLPIRDFVVVGMYPKSFGETEGFAMKTTPVLYTARWAYAPAGARGTPESYNVIRDPGAVKNLAGNHPWIVARHHAMLLNWLREMGAPEDTIAVMNST
jgi:arylsulfatase A-like enzyme